MPVPHSPSWPATSQSRTTSLGRSGPVVGGLLAGLIGRHHGREAICAYLGIRGEDLLDRVVALDLPTPSDTPMRRRAGPRAWTLDDITRLIEAWIAASAVAIIGSQLHRSSSAVYAKVRWLGLPKRDRSRVLASGKQGVIGDAPGAKQGRVRHVVQTADGRHIPIPTIPARGHVRWSGELDLELANRYWANQHYEAIAAEWGLSPRTIASRACRLELPPRDRAKLVAHYDPSIVAQNIAAARYLRRECLVVPGWWFWSQRDGPRTSKRGQKIRARNGGGFGLALGHSISSGNYSLAL